MADSTKIDDIRDYGEPFLGMEVMCDCAKHTIKLTQARYIEQMTKRFSMLDSNYVATPLSPSTKLTSIDDSAHPCLIRSCFVVLLAVSCMQT